MSNKPTKKQDEKKLKSHYREGDYGVLCDFIIGEKKTPLYLWQCVSCGEHVHSENVALLHCDRLTQWVAGIPGKGIDMASPRVKINVSGYIEMSQEQFDILLGTADPHKAIVYAIHMGYTMADNLEFEPEE